MEEIWTYNYRVDETEGAFASSNTLLVDESQDRGEDWRRQGCSAYEPPRPIGIDHLTISDCGYIGISTSTVVVDTSSDRAEITIFNIVVVSIEAEVLLDLVEVAGDSITLVIWDAKDVREAATAGESVGGNLMKLGAWFERNRGVKFVPLRAADREDVWARAGEIDLEDLALVTVASVSGSDVGADTRITRRHDDGSALESKLHPFIALSLKVEIGQGSLIGTIGDGDNVGWLIDTALQLTLVSTRMGVRVLWV